MSSDLVDDFHVLTDPESDSDYGEELAFDPDLVSALDDSYDDDFGAVNLKTNTTTNPQAAFQSKTAADKRSTWAKSKARKAEVTNEVNPRDCEAVMESGTERGEAASKPIKKDLVIVGAGIAGLYTLWKILQSDTKIKTIMMVEQADHFGGRLRTDIITAEHDRDDEDIQFVACEEGGMRLCWLNPEQVGTQTQVMPKLIDLIGDLDLTSELEHFRMVPKGIDNRRNWYSGNSFTEWYAKQNMKIWDDTFFLDPNERNKSPGAIMTEVYRTILKENYSKLIELVGSAKDAKIVLVQKEMPRVRLIQARPDYWYNFAKYFTWNDIAIYKYTLTSLMTIMGYSQGCIRMLDQASGFQCFTEGKGNAGVILQMSMTHASMTEVFFCFRTGFSTLVNKLVGAINKLVEDRNMDDNWLLLNETLVNVDLAVHTDKKLGDDRSLLTMIGPARPNEPNSQQDEGDQIALKTWQIKAKRVVLAIPRHSLYHVKIEGIPAANGDWVEVVDSVWDVTMTKINLYFSHPWWNQDQDDVLYGPSSTDLPIAQVYPFYQRKRSTSENVGATRKDQPRYEDLCALTLYCDVQNSGFWSDLQSLPGTFTSAFQSEEANKRLIPASLEVVKEAIRELQLLFNVKDIPYPVLTTYTCWGDSSGIQTNPAAIHQWKRGIDDRKIREKMVKPFSGKNVYVCNEAWSSFQGWVEGSLMSAEAVIQLIQKEFR